MKIYDMPKDYRPREKNKPRFDKVEMYWGKSHDVINTKTRKCVATFWTKEEAQKEGEYFPEYVGIDLKALDSHRGTVYAKKAKDGVLDVIVNVKRFNRHIFTCVVEEVLEK